MTLNVNRNNPDPFYRYKMPPLVIKPEGRGNGKKTVLENVVDVAEALSRPPGYVTKYLGVEFGAGTQVDGKGDAKRFIMKGYFMQDELQKALDNFIRIFVLCQECDNPETVLSVTKQQQIHQKCAACGHAQLLKNQGHKLCNYIINNPPDVSVEYGSKKKEAAKKKTNTSSKKKAANNDDFETIRTAKDDDEDDDDWVEDVSEEAVAARTAAIEAELGDGLSRLAVGGSMKDMPEDERVERFYNYLAAGKHNSDPKTIIAEAERLIVPAHMGVLFLVESLFKDVKTLEDDIVGEKKKAFMHFLKGRDEKVAKHFLGAMEIVLSDKKATDQTSDILTFLFEERYVLKQGFLTWAEKGPTKKWTKKKYSERVHAAAADFLEWLQEQDDVESEEEEDNFSEDDGDDDLEVAFDDGFDEEKSKQAAKANGNGAAAAPKVESMFGDSAAGDDDDFSDDDIDDI